MEGVTGPRCSTLAGGQTEATTWRVQARQQGAMARSRSARVARACAPDECRHSRRILRLGRGRTMLAVKHRARHRDYFALPVPTLKARWDSTFRFAGDLRLAGAATRQTQLARSSAILSHA